MVEPSNAGYDPGNGGLGLLVVSLITRIQCVPQDAVLLRQDC